jgi:hypothetical protein
MDKLTNIIALHFDNSIFTKYEVCEYLLDMGLTEYYIQESEMWYDVKISDLKRLDNDTRIKYNDDFTIIIEYELLEIKNICF